MESIREVRQALAARSQTKSLDELQSDGRRRVKVIRAEHIAAMIDEAVQRTVAESGLLSREEVDDLVARSRSEFAAVHAERQREAQELHEARRDLEESNRRRDALAQQVGSLEEDLGSLERDLGVARARVHELEGQLQRAQQSPTPAPAAGMPADAMLRMMEELATLKARMEVGAAPAASQPAAASPPPAAPVPPAPAAAAPVAPAQSGDALASALDKLTASMTERLEQMGRKMGISSAVEADAVKLDGLLSDLADQKVESNLDTLEVKQRQAGGIAANLARLKKLKGGN